MNRRSKYGVSWWGQRWLAALESFGWDSRLQRGRTYARGGHVLEVEIGKGSVEARVSGSRPQPYRVKITLTPLTELEWRRTVERLLEQPLLVGQLLAGEMPQEIEAAFVDAKASLFPAKSGDLTTSCSCPDWANPCKHVAAVYYVLAERFDNDPFLLFEMRGMSQEALLKQLRDRWTRAQDEGAVVVAEARPLRTQDDLWQAAVEGVFWHARADVSALTWRFDEAEAVADSLPRLLGVPPMGENWSQELKEEWMRFFPELYQKISAETLRKLES